MKRKRILITIMTLFMVLFIPNIVEATEEYYVCYLKSSSYTSDSSRHLTYQDPYYFYKNDGLYGKEYYIKKGRYPYNSVPKTESPYTLYKTIDDSGKCIDAYVGDETIQTTFTYDEFNELSNTVINEDNKFNMTKYKELYVADADADIDIPSTSTNTSPENNYTQCEDGWWGCAWKFLNSGSNSEHQFGENGIDSAISGIKDLIFDVGNVIFILVTAFLGVKYIWGGVDSKFSVKNSLMTLIVAAIVFYGWDAVTNILDVQGLLTGTDAAGNHMSMVNRIYNTIMYIINIGAVGGIIYIGIKYMMAGAEGKSELKLKGIPVVMGIIMVYGTINLITFILKIVEGL